jgi:hypothetical protein
VAGARLGRARDFAALVELAGPRLLAHARSLTDDVETARDTRRPAPPSEVTSDPADLGSRIVLAMFGIMETSANSYMDYTRK